MKKILIIAIALFIVSCSEKKIQKEDFIGKWDAVYEIKDTTDISSKSMLKLMLCEFRYEFSPDTIYITKSIGAMNATHPYKWDLKNDSIFVSYPDTTAGYKIEKSEEGYVLYEMKIRIELKNKS